MNAALHIQIMPHPEHGATLSCQAGPHDGASCSRLECSPEVVQRSRVLKELLATTQGSPRSTALSLPLHQDVHTSRTLASSTTLTLPLRQDAFHAWHAFDANEESSPRALCKVLQVCRAHSTVVQLSASILHTVCIKRCLIHCPHTPSLAPPHASCVAPAVIVPLVDTSTCCCVHCKTLSALQCGIAVIPIHAKSISSMQ